MTVKISSAILILMGKSRKTGYTTRGPVIAVMGRGRIDLLIRKPYTGLDGKPARQREALELKVRAKDQRDPLNASLKQLDEYLTWLGLETGALVIFDRRPSAAPIGERTGFDTARTPSGRAVTLLRA